MLFSLNFCSIVKTHKILYTMWTHGVDFINRKVIMSSLTPPEKLLIGAHTSAAGGVSNASVAANKIGATTFQLFTANQKQWKGKEISAEEADKFLSNVKEFDQKQIMSHASYLINLGSVKPELIEKSREAFQRELLRCTQLRLSYLNFHPGAFTTGSLEESLDLIVESLKSFAPILENSSLRLLLETTAGQGSTIGHRFEHLDYIIKQVQDFVPIGVCIDTCHIFAAGYDISTHQSWDNTLAEFDQVIGLKHLYAFHLNDSKFEVGLKKDRHENLGHGKIGLSSFKFLMTDKRVRDLPKYLETPNGDNFWKEEIQTLRKLAEKEKVTL